MYKISSIFPRFCAHLLRKTLFAALLLIVAPLAMAQESPLVYVGSFEQEVGEVIEKIEKQTDYRFAHDFDFDLSRKVKPKQEAMSLAQLLEVILEGTNLTYKITINTVILNSVPLPKERNSAEVEQKKATERADLFLTVLSGEQKALLPNATVVLTNKSDTLVDITNEKGEVVAKLTAGNYRVSVLHPTHIEYSANVVAVEGYNSVVVELEAAMAGELPTAEFVYEGTKSLSATSSRSALLMSVAKPIKQRAPIVAIKTNLLQGATASLNLGFEFRLSERLSLEIPVSYNPWTFDENKKLKHLLVQPELRYWTREVFNGHFVGIHTHYAHFNVGGVDAPFNIWQGLKSSRYQGDLYGVGFSYGYQFIIGQRWSMELTAGVGYFHAKYNKFGCKTCGEYKQAGIKNYFGPTKLGLSFIFIIK